MPGVQLNGGTTMLRLMVALLFVLVGCGPVGLVEQAPGGAHIDASAGGPAQADAPAVPDVTPAAPSCSFGVALGSAAETSGPSGTEDQAVGDWALLMFAHPAHIIGVTMTAGDGTLLPVTLDLRTPNVTDFGVTGDAQAKAFTFVGVVTDGVRFTIARPSSGPWLPAFSVECAP